MRWPKRRRYNRNPSGVAGLKFRVANTSSLRQQVDPVLRTLRASQLRALSQWQEREGLVAGVGSQPRSSQQPNHASNAKLRRLSDHGHSEISNGRAIGELVVHRLCSRSGSGARWNHHRCFPMYPIWNDRGWTGEQKGLTAEDAD